MHTPPKSPCLLRHNQDGSINNNSSSTSLCGALPLWARHWYRFRPRPC